MFCFVMSSFVKLCQVILYGMQIKIQWPRERCFAFEYELCGQMKSNDEKLCMLDYGGHDMMPTLALSITR